MIKPHRITAAVLAAVLAVGLIGTGLAGAADSTQIAIIDESLTGSLSIYKYDLTKAEQDGVWDASAYVSTGQYDETVNQILGQTQLGSYSGDHMALGNGTTSDGYAISGVVFTLLRLGDMVQYRYRGETVVLAELEEQSPVPGALGLTDGDRYPVNAAAPAVRSGYVYYTPDTLSQALEQGLETNATAVKNTLETLVRTSPDRLELPETDDQGYTGANNLALGTYLLVETAVPEFVVDTTNPVLLTLPMTSVAGGANGDGLVPEGGDEWLYELTLYPKNLTNHPTLEKTVREDARDTGHNLGSDSDTEDGYTHTATASEGDRVDFQVLTTMPSITSQATWLTSLTFHDQLSAGMEYLPQTLEVDWFADPGCTQELARWQEGTDFTVSYGEQSDGSHTMDLTPTELGYQEINTSEVLWGPEQVLSGYSDCTVRITYDCLLDSDASFVCGDGADGGEEGNWNRVALTWSRSNSSYYDSLEDQDHVYSYGLDLTKTFSDAAGDLSQVEFVLYNETDGYYVLGALDGEEGVYYVTGRTEQEAEATRFVPVTEGTVADTDGAASDTGKLLIRGLEDDNYTLTEVHTDSGYALLGHSISLELEACEDETCGFYDTEQTWLGVVQNDPRFSQSLLEAVAADHGYAAVDAWLDSLTNAFDAWHSAGTNDLCAVVNLLRELGALDASLASGAVTQGELELALTQEQAARTMLEHLALVLLEDDSEQAVNHLLQVLAEQADPALGAITSIREVDGGYTVLAGVLYRLGALDYYWQNLPQKYMEHTLLCGSAKVDGQPVNLTTEAQTGSAHALVQVSVVNTRGYHLPMTGGVGLVIWISAGAAALAGAAAWTVVAVRRRRAS